MTENGWKWQPKFISPPLLLKMKISEKDMKIKEEMAKLDVPRVPKGHRVPPLALHSDSQQQKLSVSLLSNQIHSFRTHRKKDVEDITERVATLPIKIR